MFDSPGPWPQTRKLRAFAKVNLSLRVLGKRPDGYHEIRTLLQTISLSDSVSVSLEPGGPAAVALTCDRADLQGERNLAWRAADLVLRRTGVQARVSVRLRKVIPAGAGLGGGSSDAAAVIRAIAAMLPQRPAADVLLDAAAELGSDVPFFLVGGSAIGTGRGTELEPLPDLPTAALVIARPDVEVSTAWAYAALAAGPLALTRSQNVAKMQGIDWDSDSLSGGPLEGLGESMVNDFESVVFQRYPAIADLKRRLRASGARHALMSGSGSAVFGVFKSYQAANSVAETLRADGFGAWPAEYVARTANGTVLVPASDTPSGKGSSASGAQQEELLLGESYRVE